MSIESSEDKAVCCDCIRDPILRRMVVTEEEGKCSFCQMRDYLCDFDALADAVDNVLGEYFVMETWDPEGVDRRILKEGLWEPPGEPIEDVIGAIAAVDFEVASEIRAHLEERVIYGHIKHGDENPYEETLYYREATIQTWGYQESWESFKDRLRHHARFFDNSAVEYLSELFDGLEDFSTLDGNPVLRIEGNPDTDLSIYRGRLTYSDEKLSEIVTDPAAHLGPPPPASARAGRMNPSGISVFYGAFDAPTCVAECRPPVGSSVVTARFSLTRPLRILDLDRLRAAYGARYSYFDDEAQATLARIHFLKQLVDEIARPIMPTDEEFEYLPTQAVADFLANQRKPEIDGIVFDSSQRRGDHKNIVLFHHACRVERPQYGTKDVEVRKVQYAPDDDYKIEVVRPKPNEGAATDSGWAGQHFETDTREVTLVFDRGSVEVHEVTSVEHARYVQPVQEKPYIPRD